MQFEWDVEKNRQNQQKHGIDFEQAREVFEDPLHLSTLDKRFSYFEERWVTIGATHGSQLLVVANLFFSDTGEEIIRIISARNATSRERQQYEHT